MIFLRDVEQAENWVVKQEVSCPLLHDSVVTIFYSPQSVMSSEEEGDSLESVEGLLKKHENYQKSLATQEEKFKVSNKSSNTACISPISLQAIDESAEVMIASEHYASNEITSKRKAVRLHKTTPPICDTLLFFLGSFPT